MTLVNTARGDHVFVGVLVVQTFLCCEPKTTESSFFEVHVTSVESEPPAVLITREADLYAAAVVAEGTDQRLDVGWRRGKRPNGEPAQILTALWRSA